MILLIAILLRISNINNKYNDTTTTTTTTSTTTTTTTTTNYNDNDNNDDDNSDHIKTNNENDINNDNISNNNDIIQAVPPRHGLGGARAHPGRGPPEGVRCDYEGGGSFMKGGLRMGGPNRRLPPSFLFVERNSRISSFQPPTSTTTQGSRPS